MTTIPERETSPKPIRPAPLSLKRSVRVGEVEQRFSRGRSKTVTVEAKRRSSPIRAWRAPETAAIQLSEQDRTPAPVNARPSGRAFAREFGTGARLSEAERTARMRAVEQAWKEERARQSEREVQEERRAEAAARLQAEQHRLQAEAKRETEERARLALEQVRRFRAEAPAKASEETGTGKRDETRARHGRGKRLHARRAGGTAPRERRLSVTSALDEGDGRVPSLASIRRQREKARAGAVRPAAPKVIRDVVLPEALTVRDLALRMAEPAGAVVKALITLGERATMNDTIDADTAELLVAEFGHRARRAAAPTLETHVASAPDHGECLRPRPPVVTVMGHVDHGKTSLLDALRKTDVAAHEAGGITQHIGAYQVELASGARVTFVDTPGHAAFSDMRARGANLTDIVVLVVAADDGVMEQTVEAIRHAQAAGVPIVVAINKTDLPSAALKRIKQQLLNHGIVVEEMGGEVLAVDVSAKTGANLEQLLEAILLQAEVLELKANPARSAEGVIVEAKLDRGRGPVATLLVQRGTLRPGDVVVAGCEWGRVRALINERRERVAEAGPGTPAEVLGLSGLPNAGDRFAVVAGEAHARAIGEARQAARRATDLADSGRGTLEHMLARIKQGETRELNVVIKADAQGSVEAITASLGRLANDEVALRVLHAAVGGISESDVSLARASDAVIIGFNVRPTPQARELARRQGVEIRSYGIIYELVEDVRAALSDLLPPAREERVLGAAEIRQVFSVTGAGKVAGCMVTEGLIRRGAGARLIRDAVVVHDGRIKTLRRFKDDAGEVKAGYECGLALEGYQDIRVGDRVECYAVEEVARRLPAAA